MWSWLVVAAMCAVASGSLAAAGAVDAPARLFQEVMMRSRMEDGGPGHMLPRDEEYLQHGAALWGHQYMTGGAGEGYQRLRPEGSIQNVHQVKTDAHLPAYCNPPNPCPVGYSSSAHCMEGMPNSAAFVREYQEREECMCDREHMISCPPGPGDGAEQGPGTAGGEPDRDQQEMLTNAIQSILYPEEDFDERHIGLVAKKGDTWNLEHNPYLTGDRLPVVAKKAPGMFH